MLLVLRFVIALIFIVSGFEKLISPSENFLYVLQAYAVFPDVIARIASVVFPWIELGIGVFLALGLWLRPAVMALACMSGSLIMVVAQAIIRQLPIDSCGCFGELIHLPLKGVIILDLVIFASAIFFLRDMGAVRRFSLDKFYDTASS
jgi:triosephosphate isomerase